MMKNFATLVIILCIDSVPKAWSQEVNLNELNSLWERDGEIEIKSVCRGEIQKQKKVHSHKFVSNHLDGSKKYSVIYVTRAGYSVCEHGNCGFFCNLDCSYTFSDTILNRTVSIQEGENTRIIGNRQWVVNGSYRGSSNVNCNTTINNTLNHALNRKLGSYDQYRYLIDKDIDLIEETYKP